MAITYDAIATVTVGSGGAASMEFTSISGTYTDLLIKISGRTSENAIFTNNGFEITFNNNTSGYTSRLLYGVGDSQGSVTNSSGALRYVYGTAALATASTFGNAEVYIPNYAGSNNKSISADSVSENNATTAVIALTAGLWSNSAAITSIKISSASGNFVQHSTATLYGIKNTV